MAGLQTIIDKANGLTIDRRKVVGLQFTRNEIPRVTLTPTRNPWKFILEMPGSLRYYDNRDLLETLDNLDRIGPQIITFSNNACLNWIFRYQGSMNQSQINNISVTSFVGTTLRLSNLPAVSANTILFRQNDLIQLGNNPYPFTVVGSWNGSTTTYGNITRGIGSFVDITMNRPNILSSPVTGLGITVGNACDFYMFCPNMPTYKLIPGGYVGNATTTLNNARIEFTDNFTFYEYVGTA